MAERLESVDVEAAIRLSVAMGLRCCRRLQTASSPLETFKDELHKTVINFFFADSLSKLLRSLAGCVLPQILNAIAWIHCTTTRAHVHVGLLIIDATRA